MATRASLPKSVAGRPRVHAGADLSAVCALSIVGLLVGFVAVVHGLMAASLIPAALPVQPMGGLYWGIVILGVWLPAIGIMGSIVGLVLRNRYAIPVLILSPVISIIGYALYTWVPLKDLIV